jgi:hypothetical protein
MENIRRESSKIMQSSISSPFPLVAADKYRDQLLTIISYAKASN